MGRGREGGVATPNSSTSKTVKKNQEMKVGLSVNCCILAMAVNNVGWKTLYHKRESTETGDGHFLAQIQSW